MKSDKSLDTKLAICLKKDVCENGILVSEEISIMENRDRVVGV